MFRSRKKSPLCVSLLIVFAMAVLPVAQGRPAHKCRIVEGEKGRNGLPIVYKRCTRRRPSDYPDDLYMEEWMEVFHIKRKPPAHLFSDSDIDRIIRCDFNPTLSECEQLKRPDFPEIVPTDRHPSHMPSSSTTTTPRWPLYAPSTATSTTTTTTTTTNQPWVQPPLYVPETTTTTTTTRSPIYSHASSPTPGMTTPSSSWFPVLYTNTTTTTAMPVAPIYVPPATTTTTTATTTTTTTATATTPPPPPPTTTTDYLPFLPDLPASEEEEEEPKEEQEQESEYYGEGVADGESKEEQSDDDAAEDEGDHEKNYNDNEDGFPN